MTFEEVCGILGLIEPSARMRETWAMSQAAYGEGSADFLAPTQLAAASAELGMPSDFAAAATAAAAAVRESEALRRYVWHCRWLLTDPAADWPVAGAGFPPIPTTAARGAGMAYALVFLDMLPVVRERYRVRGVEAGIVRDTLADFARWVGEFRQKEGAWGLSNLGWMQNHARARIFALGRLQFRLEHYAFDFHAWREKKSGRVLLLAGAGMRFRADGQFADADRAEAPASDVWEAAYEEGDGRVRGAPIDPRGPAVRRVVELKRADWEPVLAKGDPTFGIHIPAGGPMDFEACGDSFARSVDFLAQTAPDHPARVWTCGSWLLDPQFEERLAETSNTVRFLREMYLHPMPGATDYAMIERVFGGMRPDPAGPVDGLSAMQKAVVAHMRTGGRWRAGASLMFRADWRWGGRVYRTMWPDFRGL